MKKEEDFVMGLSIYMACLREKKRYSTAKSYQDALNSFKCFCGMEKIPYSYINRDTLLCYQSWLLGKGAFVEYGVYLYASDSSHL